MGKKDLDSILIKTEKVLPQETSISLLDTIKTAPKKAKPERDSAILSIKITPTEMAILMAKKEAEAGKMAPLGTYVKDHLRTKTNLFTK